jgi:serine/threonine-protein kinase
MTTDVSSDRTIFLEAVEYVPKDRWEAFIKDRCGDDDELYNRVHRLLRAHSDMGDFHDHKPSSITAPQASAIDAPPSEQCGASIGPYKLLEQLGEGGMGTVYMAQQTEPVRRKVALKIIKPGMDTRQVVARFEAEQQALALMEHPNIAKVFDAGIVGAASRAAHDAKSCDAPDSPARLAGPTGRPYFVMELVRGIPITEYCDEHKLGPRQRLELFATVCRAVQHAHQKGIIHRDLKPSNVLVEQHDVTPVPKIIDFGVAKAINRELTEKTLFTNFAQMIGTPLYMSPEQAELSGLDVDTRSDIYSLGVLLYELLTGTTPFERERLHAASYDELRRIIREEEPPRPSARISTLAVELATTVCASRRTDTRRLEQTIRGDLDWIVMKCLEKDRNRRYESASALAAEVQRHLDHEPIQAGPPRMFSRVRKWSRRHRGLLAATCVTLLVSGLMSAGIMGWFARERVARQSVAEATAGSVLEEATRLMKQEKWTAALAEARRAEDILATSGAQIASIARAQELRKDIEMVLGLEEIRSGPATEQGLYGSQRLDPQTDRKNAEAFLKYGIDVESLSPIAAAERIAQRNIRLELATALDAWALWRIAFLPNDEGWERLVDIARLADPDSLRNRIRDAIGKDHDDRRATLIELAAAIDAENLPPQTALLLADLLYQSGANSEAIAPLLTARRRHPDNFRLNLQLGWFYVRQTSAEAIRYFTAAQALRPESARAQNGLGVALAKSGWNDEAFVSFQEAIRLRPDFGEAHGNLGMHFRNKGSAAKAVFHFQKLIEQFEDDPMARMVLAEILATSRDEKVRDGRRAVELAKTACELSKYKDPEMMDALAAAYAETGDFESAVKWSQKAVELTHKDEHRAGAIKRLQTFRAGHPWREEKW